MKSSLIPPEDTEAFWNSFSFFRANRSPTKHFTRKCINIMNVVFMKVFKRNLPHPSHLCEAFSASPKRSSLWEKPQSEVNLQASELLKGRDHFPKPLVFLALDIQMNQGQCLLRQHIHKWAKDYWHFYSQHACADFTLFYNRNYIISTSRK